MQGYFLFLSLYHKVFIISEEIKYSKLMSQDEEAERAGHFVLNKF
jgi:hypothetical protein